MTRATDEHMDRAWLAQAVELAQQCPVSASAFSVGAVLIDRTGKVAVTGFSRERGEAWHAEEVALAKASEQQVELRGATLYTSLEPCSQRRSPRTPCTDRLIATGIARVVYALREPPVFVKCRGLERLAAHGIEIVHYAEFEEQVRAANRHLLSRLPGLDMPPGSATQ